jgi:phosphoenolpyruvate synthase/pyruvate phosphate dikinase
MSLEPEALAAPAVLVQQMIAADASGVAFAADPVSGSRSTVVISAVFGLGTAPTLIGISLADDLLTRNRTLLDRLSQVFILVMGARFLWRALGG